jgi:hypothetical protein
MVTPRLNQLLAQSLNYRDLAKFAAAAGLAAITCGIPAYEDIYIES